MLQPKEQKALQILSTNNIMVNWRAARAYLNSFFVSSDGHFYPPLFIFIENADVPRDIISAVMNSLMQKCSTLCPT